MNDWYQKTSNDVLQSLNTSVKQGRSQAEAAQRLAQYGSNELIKRWMKSPPALGIIH
jgi:magnesium-transporting ATPase (P-type)